MLRVFVTGDNHIGLKYAGHEKAALLAAKRMSAFEFMVSTANAEECGLFVITGDLLESTCGINKRDIKELLDMLSNFHGIVVVLPGNHDYYDKEVKVWQYFRDLMSSYDNIMLLTEYRPYELMVSGEQVILYPAHCTSLHSEPGVNNLGWIKKTEIKDDGAFHIGIAHGAVEGYTIDREGLYFLMKRSELEEIPVDAWLIGHTHVPFPRDLSEEYKSVTDKVFNPGTHVQTDVSCNTEGSCFIIEMDDNKALRAKKVKTGNIRFYRKNIAVEAGSMEKTINRELQEIDDSSVADIILTGAVSADEYEDRNRIIDKALSRFIEGSCNDYALSCLISRELIDSEFPETSFSAALLSSLLDEPKEAQLTYELLKSLKDRK